MTARDVAVVSPRAPRPAAPQVTQRKQTGRHPGGARRGARYGGHVHDGHVDGAVRQDAGRRPEAEARARAARALATWRGWCGVVRSGAVQWGALRRPAVAPGAPGLVNCLGGRVTVPPCHARRTRRLALRKDSQRRHCGTAALALPSWALMMKTQSSAGTRAQGDPATLPCGPPRHGCRLRKPYNCAGICREIRGDAVPRTGCIESAYPPGAAFRRRHHRLPPRTGGKAMERHRHRYRHPCS